METDDQREQEIKRFEEFATRGAQMFLFIGFAFAMLAASRKLLQIFSGDPKKLISGVQPKSLEDEPEAEI